MLAWSRSRCVLKKSPLIRKVGEMVQKRVRFWARVPEAASKSGQKWGVCPSHSPQKGVFQQPPRT